MAVNMESNHRSIRRRAVVIFLQVIIHAIGSEKYRSSTTPMLRPITVYMLTCSPGLIHNNDVKTRVEAVTTFRMLASTLQKGGRGT